MSRHMYSSHHHGRYCHANGCCCDGWHCCQVVCHHKTVPSQKQSPPTSSPPSTGSPISFAPNGSITMKGLDNPPKFAGAAIGPSSWKYVESGTPLDVSIPTFKMPYDGNIQSVSTYFKITDASFPPNQEQNIHLSLRFLVKSSNNYIFLGNSQLLAIIPDPSNPVGEELDFSNTFTTPLSVTKGQKLSLLVSIADSDFGTVIEGDFTATVVIITSALS